MSKGFFHSSTITKQAPTNSLIPKCGACGLFKNCNSPKLPVYGSGGEKVLIVLESPSEAEDNSGVPLAGRSGSFFKNELSSLGLDVRNDCWVSHALICHPNKVTPSEKHVGYCRPNILKVIKELKPNLILLLGQLACKSVLEKLWGSDVGPVTRWAGRTIPYQKWNTWIVPTYSPSFVYSRLQQKRPDKKPYLYFRNHLKEAVRLSSSKPWEKTPNYDRMVRCIHSPLDATKELKKFYMEKPKYLAFDYETNMLKPDSSESKIYSCSVCIKRKDTGRLDSIAYPWTRDTAKATRALLRSPSLKIASNLKFEERWTRALLKTPVRNWWHDTMLASFVSSNVEKTSSIKFQAFCLLGFAPYNDHIEPFLQSEGDNCYSLNRITDIEMNDLLYYNALDSLLEYLVAFKQRKHFR